MKSVVTLWEPLAMALNSTPSRSMSLGRHHSSMFPITPTQHGGLISFTHSQAGYVLIQEQTVLSQFLFMLMKQQWHSPSGFSWNWLSWTLMMKHLLGKYCVIGTRDGEGDLAKKEQFSLKFSDSCIHQWYFCRKFCSKNFSCKWRPVLKVTTFPHTFSFLRFDFSFPLFPISDVNYRFLKLYLALC